MDVNRICGETDLAMAESSEAIKRLAGLAEFFVRCYSGHAVACIINVSWQMTSGTSVLIIL